MRYEIRILPTILAVSFLAEAALAQVPAVPKDHPDVMNFGVKADGSRGIR